MNKGNKIALIIVVITTVLVVSIIGVTIFLLNTKVKEIDNKDLVYDKEIKSITIRYFIGYNVATGDAIKDTIPAFEIDLEGEELEKAAKLVRTIEYYEIPNNDTQKYNYIEAIDDQFELIVNNDIHLYLGNKQYGFVKNPYKTFKIPKDLFYLVSYKVGNNNADNIYKKLGGNNFTILHNNEKVEITDSKYIDEISKYNYYRINGKDEAFKDEKNEYTLDLGDGRRVEVYTASVLSRLVEKDGSYYYIYSGDLEDLVKKIYNNSKVNLFSDNIKEIKVNYQGNEYIINDQSTVKDMLNELKYMKYNDYNYTVNTSESDFDDNDIIINVGNTKYIIPGESFVASRYFIDENGKVYDITGMNGSLTEKYVKNLVRYIED